MIGLWLTAAPGCEPAAGLDGGTDDAGARDAGRLLDAGAAFDAGPPVDAGRPDSGTRDAGPGDAAVADAGHDAGGVRPAIDSGAPTLDAGVLQSYACGSATGAVFVTEVAPPAVMVPSQALETSVTFANCTASVWNATDANAPTGYKLGFDAPRESDTWGQSHLALPASVAPGESVRIAITGRATPLTGLVGYRWAIVHEGVEWLGQASPLHQVSVQGPTGMVTLCPGQTGDTSGATSASSALQACIDATPSGGTLEVPPGVYRITGVVAFTHPMTLRTAGTALVATNCMAMPAPGCAIFRADDALDVPRGFVRFEATTDVVVDHLIIDGNRIARLASAAAATCASGTNGAGFNAATSGCVGCSFTRGVSARALCGTGWEWNGPRATVTDSVFRDNGDFTSHMMWADGLTVSQSNDALVAGNFFLDNSDVDLIIGGGTNSRLHHNTVLHVRQPAYAGLMLDNFNGGASGDFTGAVVEDNVVSCGAPQCDFAIELGPHAWYLSANLIGGTVQNNSASGGKINLNVEGVGTAAAPMVLINNTVGVSASQATFTCGTRATTAFNLSPDSYVTLSGAMPTGSIEFHVCP